MEIKRAFVGYFLVGLFCARTHLEQRKEWHEKEQENQDLLSCQEGNPMELQKSHRFKQMDVRSSEGNKTVRKHNEKGFCDIFAPLFVQPTPQMEVHRNHRRRAQGKR